MSKPNVAQSGSFECHFGFSVFLLIFLFTLITIISLVEQTDENDDDDNVMIMTVIP